MFFIYFTSVFFAILLALILKKYIFKNTKEPFKQGFYPLRMPSIKTISRNMWFNSRLFLKKITGAILIASIVIWVLSYFPNNFENKNIEKSYIGSIGKFIEPVIKPLGFDWRMGISIITGIAAKETTTGTISMLFQKEHKAGNDKQNLIENLQSQVYLTGDRIGQKVFTPLVALSFMFFISIYTPCIATITTIKKTTKSNKWTLFVIAYTSILAWVVSFTIFTIGGIFI
ncbi:MAG: ferrous iron transporter B [Bacteroidetes bacterium]|nr:ferrous iron transporter B [Bacteroidota bacterium]